MRHAFIGLCIFIFTAACGQSPTSPSDLAGVGAQTQASSARSVGTSVNGAFKMVSSGAPMDPVEVSFTKWITVFPAMAGVTGGDVPGTFAGAVLSRDPFDNGTIVQLEARYGVTAADPAHSFVARIEGKQNPTNSVLRRGGNRIVDDSARARRTRDLPVSITLRSRTRSRFAIVTNS